MHSRPSYRMRDLILARNQLKISARDVENVTQLLKDGDASDLACDTFQIADDMWALAESTNITLHLTRESLSDEASQLARAFEVFVALGWTA